jgi:isopropylmalate/isohomocitrate dehydrogenase-like protein
LVKIVVLPGDGIGPEVIEAAVKVLRSLMPSLTFEYFEIGLELFKRTGETITGGSVEELKKVGVGLLGPVSSPLNLTSNYKSPVLTLRRELDLYANVRPIRNFPGVPSFFTNVDLVVIRENLEGLYSMIEVPYDDGYAAYKVITKRGSFRIAKFAFEYARREGRRKITVIHKANVLRKTFGLFREIFYTIAKDYPDIDCDEKIVDTAAMLMATNPSAFDVVLTTNLFGDIISSIGAGVTCGLGLAPSANIGDRCVLFTPLHGSAPDIVGKNIANPGAAILSAAMLLNHLGFKNEAKRIENALIKTVIEGVKTRDIGGSASTTEFTSAVIERLWLGG